MMDATIALCDGASLPSDLQVADLPIIKIDRYSPAQNLRLGIENVSHSLLKNLSDLSKDFLEIAAYVYYADGSVKRGTNKDVFAEQWTRKFVLVIPVRRPDFWGSEDVKSLLIELLEYLTEDRFNFLFTKRDPHPEQLILAGLDAHLPVSSDGDCVMLFSGGMDSLAGAIYLQSSGRKPILASHQSNPVLAHLQRGLARRLREKFSDWHFPHLDITVNRKGEGSPADENSQRSRSFLFLTFGALAAFELGLDELVVCENGVTTFNLPRIGQTLGSMASRSTHPRVIRTFQQLARRVFSPNFRVSTPFLWKTRSEVLRVLKENNSDDLLPLSVSCNHSRRPKIHPHCGTCSQCVDRRFSVAFTGLEKYEDESLGYEKDIFVDELTEGEERMQAMSPVQFSLAIKAYDVNTFCSKYVQVYDAIDSLEGDEEQNLQAIYDLHLRFANEIHDVMSQKHARNWEKLFNHELPATCLLMLTGPRAHRRSSPMIARQAEILIQRLESCPVTVIKPFEDLCEDIFTFLFCEDVPAEEALRRPNSQFGTDQGYERRDLVFRNQASRGFWAQIRSSYEAEGIVLDAKNYKDELDADTVRGFSSKYLKSRGLGLFGVLVARKVPSETRINVATSDRVPGVVHAQKVEWQTNGKMIVLLDDEDVKQMLRMKAEGQNPTELLDDRIYTLKARM